METEIEIYKNILGIASIRIHTSVDKWEKVEESPEWKKIEEILGVSER